MAEHRVYIAFANNEMMKDAQAPTKKNAAELKGLARYVKGRERAVLDVVWQPLPIIITIPVDSDCAGDKLTRCSRSGGIVRAGSHT